MKIYESQGHLADADCVLGHSFGSSTDPASVNAELAQRMLQVADGRPMIADRTLVDAMPTGESLMACTVDGERTNIRAQGVGTWGTLLRAREYMAQEGLSQPVMIAQAFHITRVVKQAAKLGIHSIVPAELPTDFDTRSEQIWTRSPYLWIPFNALGSLLLKKRGQL